MNTNAILVGLASIVIGLFFIAIFAIGYLSVYLYGWATIIAVLGMVLWSTVMGAMIKQQPQKYKLVIMPILSTVILNLFMVTLFVQMDRQLFQDFVNDFGLSGSWSLFTLTMHANINGIVKTYPYANSTITLLLLCVAGNISLSAVYLTRAYRDKEKTSQQIQPSPIPS
jgi:hypothetical protein